MKQIRLENVELGNTIGVGTVGTIIEVTDPSDQSKYAVKILHPGVSSDPLIRARFKREMVILHRLSHRNIIRYYGGGQHNGQLYFVMERVEGGSVKELLSDAQRLTWNEVVSITIQVCSALQYAHNHGVIHRDIKPANIFLTGEGTVKLGDFGIARDLHHADLTQDRMTVGTHAYMSPEQIMGDSTITGKADLYALGCCVYEMLTGRKAFSGESLMQMFEAHLHQAAPSVLDVVSDCPAEFDPIIRRLLEKDPRDRPFNARQVQGELLQLAAKHPVEPLPAQRAAPSHGVATEAIATTEAIASTGPAIADVGAETALGVGQGRLKDRIQRKAMRVEQSQVSWQRLLVVIGLIVAAIAVLAQLR